MSLPKPKLSPKQIKELGLKMAASMSLDSLKAMASRESFFSYQDNPIGFCETVLGETITPDVRAMMESVRDHQVTVAVSANAVGKSWGAARIATWFYICHPHTKVFTAAAPPLENLKNILWGEIGAVKAKHPDAFKGHTFTSLDIRRGPEDFLTGVTIPSSGTAEEREAKFSGKHQEHLMFVLDEGDAIPDDVYQGIESCMSGGRKVRLLIMLNPRHQSGAVWRMQRDKTAHVVHLSAFRHPNVITGTDIIPGAVTRETTVRRINEWTRPIKEGEKIDETSSFELPTFLIGETAKRQDGSIYPPLLPGYYKIVNAAFSYMVLGQYPAQAPNQLISQEWISRARTRYDIYVAQYGDVPPSDSLGIMGLDVAELGDDVNCAVGRYGGYLTSFDTWGDIDTVETGEKAIKWYRSHKGIVRANVDATGVGAGVAPYMQKKDCVSIPIKVASKPTIKTDIGEFRILRDELWWRVREWLRTDSVAMLPPDEELIEELLCPTYNTETGKIEVMKKKDMKEILSRSCNKADALCMTFAGQSGFFAGCVFENFPEEE
jgi:hypothetical protein